MSGLPLTQLIHENMAVVTTFVFSQATIKRLIEDKFVGEWGYLKKFCCEIPAKRAIRASLEIAVLIRLLDEQQKVANYFRQVSPNGLRSFGVLHSPDDVAKGLTLRDLTNKILHAAELKWDLSDSEAPKLICTSPQDQTEKFGWNKAEVDIVSLAAFCSELVS